MASFSDINDLDFGDIGSWPQWVKMIGVGLIVGVILFAGYWFLIKDQVLQHERVQREEQQLRQTYLNKKALAINLEAYRKQMEQISEDFAVLLRQLPEKTEVPELLIDITQAGLGRGLQFELFKPDKPRSADFYAELPINIQVSGPYHQLGEFISDLAALPRIVSIGDLEVVHQKDSGLLQLTAVTKTYHALSDDEIDRIQTEREKVRTKP